MFLIELLELLRLLFYLLMYLAILALHLLLMDLAFKLLRLPLLFLNQVKQYARKPLRGRICGNLLSLNVRMHGFLTLKLSLRNLVTISLWDKLLWRLNILMCSHRGLDIL